MMGQKGTPFNMGKIDPVLKQVSMITVSIQTEDFSCQNILIFFLFLHKKHDVGNFNVYPHPVFMKK